MARAPWSAHQESVTRGFLGVCGLRGEPFPSLRLQVVSQTWAHTEAQERRPTASPATGLRWSPRTWPRSAWAHGPGRPSLQVEASRPPLAVFPKSNSSRPATVTVRTRGGRGSGCVLSSAEPSIPHPAEVYTRLYGPSLVSGVPVQLEAGGELTRAHTSPLWVLPGLHPSWARADARAAPLACVPALEPPRQVQS